MNELMQIGVVLAAEQGRFLKVRRRIAMRDQVEQLASDRVEFHSGSIVLSKGCENTEKTIADHRKLPNI